MEPTIPSPPTLLPQRLRWLAFTMRIVLWLVAAAWVLFGLTLFVLHGWIVPRIGEFRPRLEIEASKALGVPVRIGGITAHSRGMIPSFELRDVTLLDAQGREALRLPVIIGALSASSIWGLGFEQLYIDKPELDIRRTVDGKIHVGGLDVSQDRDAGHSAAADWFFSQTEFVLRGGTVRWTDEMHSAPPLALTQVDWVMRNTRRRHLMRLDATPPAEWGDRFTARGVFRQSLLSSGAGDFDAWTGQLFAEFGRLDASRIRPYVNMDALGVVLTRGNGALRAWADVTQGRVIGGTADVALQDVDVKLGTRLQPLAFDSVAGRVGGSQRANGFDFNTEGLRFRTRDGLQWPGGNVALTHTGDEAGAAQHTELKADKLDLDALAQIANRLPLDASVHGLIASFAPKGLVETVEARWQGPMDAPAAYAAKGRVAGLSLASLPTPTGVPAGHPRPGRPGIRGASIDFDLTQAGGRAGVKILKGSLDLPGVFEDPLVPFDQLSVDVQWKLSGRKIEAQLNNLRFANADAQGEAQAAWHTDDAASAKPPSGDGVDGRFPGVLDLQGVLSRGDGERVHRYLPLVLPERVRHYVRDAVVQGEVSEVKFKVKGPLAQLPFANPAQGDFRVTAKVRNGHLAYVPKSIQPAGAAGWPALTDLSGELVFDRATLEVNGVTSKVNGLPGLQLVKGDARIADLTHDATVEVNTDLKGPLADALGFVNQSPVAGMTNHVLDRAVAGGAGEYRFRLGLPIHSIDKSRVDGTITLSGNDLQFGADTPPLTKIKGVVTVNERGFGVTNAQARLLGGDVRFEGGTRAQARPSGGVEGENVVTFKAQGVVTAEGLRQAPELGALSRIAQNATGSTAYTASLGFRRGVPELTVASSLQGVALNLPAPLNKTAEAVLPLRFENALLPGSMGPGQKLEDQLLVSIGRAASIMYVRDVSGSEPRVIRGGIGIGLEPGEAVPTQDTGVAANINLASVDLDAWQKILTDSSSGSALQASAPVAAAAAINRAAASASLTYLPTSMAIRAKELVIEGRKLNNVVVGGSREGLTWRANIDASELNGYVEFRQPGGIGAGRVYARLSRLSLAPGTATDVETLLNEQPASIPALDIVVEDLELRGKKLGRIEIDAVNRGASAAAREGVREWRLNKFNVILPEAVLTATGNWVAINAQSIAAGAPRNVRTAAERRRTVMNFKLDIADSGELLKRFGMGEVIRRGKGRLEGQVAWIGSPLSLDYPSLSGQFNVNVESGQFVKADPGIAKLLGVLSLQSLPRRLALDFRDVFSEGFAFDFVRGDVNINQGVAYTNNLQMKGVNAAVLMEGTADISKETQSIKAVVVPEVNAGTASLIATVINPAIGLGSFLAQMFLRRPLMQAATQEFHIDGTWADPRIVKIDRKAQAAAEPVQEAR
ncbi:MAG: YhdP family protein [Polaromonas sp.]